MKDIAIAALTNYPFAIVLIVAIVALTVYKTVNTEPRR